MPVPLSEKDFRKLRLARLVASPDALPRDGRPQILLAGKSNAGKSSLLNALAGQRQLARTSSTAGKTRQLLFFALGSAAYLVDLPGYGFTQSSKAGRESLRALTDAYLRSAPPLVLVLQILDIRHLPGEADLAMLEWLEAVKAPYMLLLNKADKLSRAAQERSIREIDKAIQGEMGFSLPPLAVSAVSGQGISELRREILRVLAFDGN